MDQKELMQSVNEYRKTHATFQKSLDQRSDSFQIATYDGPPFASGTPHFGHGLVGAMKDAFLRYKTMKGYKVNRDRGRDCHGLPVEKAVEKALGIDGKKDIEEKLGVEKFTEACRAYVGKTSDEWRIFVDSIGRWADMDHAYYTMDLNFMESVIRVFQTMYNKNLVYKGFKVQRCCPSCATSLSNSEVNEGYKDKQDTAITIKFKINGAKLLLEEGLVVDNDGFVSTTRAIIKDASGKILAFADPRWGGLRSLPGGRLQSGESPEEAVTRELREELGVEVSSLSYLGARKLVSSNKYNLLSYYFEVQIQGTPKLQETDKHKDLQYIEIIDEENSLGFAVKIENTIISDDKELLEHFNIFHTIRNILPQMQAFGEELKHADVNILAWTTTPRTLPSNMFLAVGKHIHYVLVFDKNSKEYYIIAEALLKQYYKNPEEYLLINIIKGEDLQGLSYEPLFPYIMQSTISDEYKAQFFKVLLGEFVSTEDGTGIVHIAPGFGMEDFEAVAQILPRAESKQWLFMPVNEYGEFTAEVDDYVGQNVFEVNKDIITRLKTEGKLIGQKSYSHSYPHCRRCETPLLSRALTSRFIKEPDLTPLTVPNAEKIGFVPESVKNRFIDTLKSAPDWNLSRNRYRGSPLPIWESTQNPEEDKIIIGTLDELYHWSTTGSKNISKHIFVRHAQSEYNPEHKHDSYGNIGLSTLGHEQAQGLVAQLPQGDEVVVVLSPLRRTLDTATPYLIARYGEAVVKTITENYLEIQKEYQSLRDAGTLQAHLLDPQAKTLHQLHDRVYMDWRITDILVPELQDQVWPLDLTNSRPTHEALTPKGECMDQVFSKIDSYITTLNEQFAGKTIITFSHKDAVIAMKRHFRHFDFLSQKDDFTAHNAEPYTFYRDHNKQGEVDLHKPYVDNYRFIKDGVEYKRVPEVMDCWFESGSMPFGQANYTGEKAIQSTDHKAFVYPADFIIEGLDQTRGRFRVMHVCGNAIMNQNSFNHVVINGLILAEDGRKMSKSLKNYPDPEYLFGRYGTDAYRLYMLSSPAVRAEPMRFSEKGVDQVYKDFTSAIINAYKFFETYAKVDNFVYNKAKISFLRHAEQDKQAMDDASFIETILRVNPDVIYASALSAVKETAEKVQQILRLHRNKDIPIFLEEGFAAGSGKEVQTYQSILDKEVGKQVLIVGQDQSFQVLWKALYDDSQSPVLGALGCISLPSHAVTNELDKWIYSALHEVGLEIEKQMDGYSLDGGAKSVLSFIDQLNNRFIRRSRRRFRANGMDNDKVAAYHTLFDVLETYIKLAAPFAPFVTEHIYLALQAFKAGGLVEGDSVHLQHFPLVHEQYINHALLEEISLVRKIISLGLFIRSKNKIAVKQPLSKMEVHG